MSPPAMWTSLIQRIGRAGREVATCPVTTLNVEDSPRQSDAGDTGSETAHPLFCWTVTVCPPAARRPARCPLRAGR